MVYTSRYRGHAEAFAFTPSPTAMIGNIWDSSPSPSPRALIRHRHPLLQPQSSRNPMGQHSKGLGRRFWGGFGEEAASTRCPPRAVQPSSGGSRLLQIPHRQKMIKSHPIFMLALPSGKKKKQAIRKACFNWKLSFFH